MTALERYLDLARKYDAARGLDDIDSVVALTQQLTEAFAALDSRERSMVLDSPWKAST